MAVSRLEWKLGGTGRRVATAFLWLLWPALLAAQEGGAFPLVLGRLPLLLAPAVDANGRTVVFGSSISPEGATATTMDLYSATAEGAGLRRLTRLAGDGRPPQGATEVAVSANGARAAFTALMPGRGNGAEEVHVLDVVTGADRTVATDTEGCIQPLLPAPLCPNCFFTCVNAPHISPDGARVLYTARRSQPFYTVNADGSGLVRLPVYSGAVAPAPQRVISRNGLVVFTSAAPFGPTFAPSATDVYVMNLDGTNIRNLSRFGNDPATYARNATISADGAVIVFELSRGPVSVSSTAGPDVHLWTVRTSGSDAPRELTAGIEDSQPSINADGSLVTFTRAGQLHVIRSDGTGLRALTSFRMSFAREPAITEDGTRIVFSIGPKTGGRGAIYSIRADGMDLRSVYAPRALNQNGITGGANGAMPSPGSLITAWGINLAPDGLAAATRFPLPESLAGLSLLVNGRVAPLLAVTPWQANAQLPPEINEGAAAFQFRFSDGTLGTAGAAEVKALAPAIFTLPSVTVAQAAAFHGGSGRPADAANPAVAGETLEIYGTGLGATEPFVAAGTPAPASPPARTLATPEVLFGNTPARVVFSGLAPGLAGVYQVNAVVPEGLRPGQHVVRWRTGAITSASFGTITVR